MTQGGEARVVARRKLCTEVAARLSQHLKDASNHFYREPAIKLRGDLKTACVQFLLEDYPEAQAAAVEQQLWTKVFYDVIKRFRAIIAQGQAAQTSNPQNLKQVTTTFLKFLKEAKEFYQKLARQLQEAYGNSGVSGNVSPELSPAPGAGPPRDPRDIRLSIYRCLICLGDLTRYEIQAVPASTYEWSPAERFYRQAIAVYPEGGNSYNNLAVISNMQGADIAAIYYYVRSLAVKDPFHIAERNLEQIFEKFRIKYEGLLAESTLPRQSSEERARRTAKSKPKVALAVLVPELSIRFARLYGLLFSTINLDLFPEVMDGAAPCLDDLLERTSVLVGPQGHGPKRSDVLLLQLVVVTIYFADKSAGNGKLPESDDTMQKEVLRHSRTLLFTLAARLLGAVTSLGDAGRIAASPIMPTICVSLQYLASTHEHLRITNADTLEMVARRDLWTSLAAFIHAAPPSAESSAVTRFALSEDRTLHSFLPLAAGHRGLEYGLEPADPPAARMHRIYMSMRDMSKVLDDPPSQAVFAIKGASQMLAAATNFQKALELSEARAGNPATLPQVPAAVPGPSAGKAAVPTHPAPVRAPWAGAPPVDDDEEDEEVIVYNPTRQTLAGTTPSSTVQGQLRAETHSTVPVPPPAAVNAAQADHTTSAPAHDGRLTTGDTTMVSAPPIFGFADDLIRDDDVPESTAAAPVSEADVEMLEVPDNYGVSAWREPPPPPMPSAALTAAVQSTAQAAQVDALSMSIHDPAPRRTPEPALGLGPVVSAPPRRTIESEVNWEGQTAAPAMGFQARRSVNPSQDPVWPGSHPSSPTRGPLRGDGAAPFSGYGLPPSNPLQALPDLLGRSRSQQQLVSAQGNQGNQISMAAMWTPDTNVQGDAAGLSRQTSPDAPLAYSGYMPPMRASSMGLEAFAQLNANQQTASFMRTSYGGAPGISLGNAALQTATPTLGDLLKQNAMLYTAGNAGDPPNSRRVTSMPAFDRYGLAADPFGQASYPAGAGLPAHENPDDPSTTYRGDDHFGAPRATSLPRPSAELFGAVGVQAPFPGVSLGARGGGQYMEGVGRTAQYPGLPGQASTAGYHPLGPYAASLASLQRQDQQGPREQAWNQHGLNQLPARPVNLPGLFSSESVFNSAPPAQTFGGLSGLSGMNAMASASWLEDYDNATHPSVPNTAMNPGLNTNPFPGSMLTQRFQPFATDTHYGLVQQAIVERPD